MSYAIDSRICSYWNIKKKKSCYKNAHKSLVEKTVSIYRLFAAIKSDITQNFIVFELFTSSKSPEIIV